RTWWVARAGRGTPGISMERRDRELPEKPERGRSDGEHVPRYEPPAVAWEEEFEAVAASPICPDSNNPDCM
ncbi:MAG TPA: hypothetical protein VMU14_01050, partial [Acidimicrobiales bacterium]|nr:hypothetical protein [Acidimicrobiales bacterium]